MRACLQVAVRGHAQSEARQQLPFVVEKVADLGLPLRVPKLALEQDGAQGPTRRCTRGTLGEGCFVEGVGVANTWEGMWLMGEHEVNMAHG